MQIHGYLHTVNPDDFGFSSDNHSHAHEEIRTNEQFDRFMQMENLEKDIPLMKQPDQEEAHDHGNGGHSH